VLIYDGDGWLLNSYIITERIDLGQLHNFIKFYL
jgi:hypothetical protein